MKHLYLIICKIFSDEFTHEHSRALTWLMPIQSSVLPSVLIGSHDTLAVRITTHPLLKDLCHALISPTNPYGFFWYRPVATYQRVHLLKKFNTSNGIFW